MNRRTLLQSLPAVAALGQPLVRSQSERTHPWPTFRQNAQRTAEAPDVPALQTTPTEAWTKSLESGITTRPITVRDGVLVGTLDDGLFKFSPDGTQQWHQSHADGEYRTPFVRDDKVYVSQGKSIQALDLDTGSLEWQLDVPARSALLVTDETVISILGVRKLIGVDRETGAERWRAQPEGSRRFEKSPSICGDLVVGTDQLNKGIHAYDTRTGRHQWTVLAPRKRLSTPVYHDETIVVASGSLYDSPRWILGYSRDGEEVFRHKLDGPGLVPSPTPYDGKLLIATTTGEIQALDPRSGEIFWSNEFDIQFDGGLHRVGDVVYALGADKAIRGVNADTGDVEWTYSVDKLGWSPPVPGVENHYLKRRDTLIAIEGANQSPLPGFTALATGAAVGAGVLARRLRKHG